MKKERLFTTLLALTSMVSFVSCSKKENACPEPEQMTDENGCVYVVEKEYEPGVLPQDSIGGLYTGYINAENLPSGAGKMEYYNSTVYDGRWEEGLWRGYCKINWDSGCVYIGEAKNSLMHGRGYMKWPMGDYYYGDWREGAPNGFGTKGYMRDGTAESDLYAYDIYTGEMVNNFKVGKGIMRYHFGAIYDGEWQSDQRSGLGVQYWEDGCEWIKFVGEFANDWISGRGTMYYADGTIVTGTWSGTEKISD